MKKSKELQKLQNDLGLHLEAMQTSIAQTIKQIKKEHNELLIDEKNKLLAKIAEGEKLDLNTLKAKYLKSKEIISFDDLATSALDDTEELLDTATINGITYYYENKEKGKVYNAVNKEVGYIKNGNITLI